MKHLVAGHRAAFGIVGSLAVVLLFIAAIQPAPSIATEIMLFVVACVGLNAIQASPYWRVVYRESPLRRAATGETDLDERELGLRDRAAGLTYFLMMTLTMLAFGLLGIGVGAHWWRLSGSGVIALILPYALVAIALPVIMIEWFEPSGAAPPADED